RSTAPQLAEEASSCKAALPSELCITWPLHHLASLKRRQIIAVSNFFLVSEQFTEHVHSGTCQAKGALKTALDTPQQFGKASTGELLWLIRHYPQQHLSLVITLTRASLRHADDAATFIAVDVKLMPNFPKRCALPIAEGNAPSAHGTYCDSVISGATLYWQYVLSNAT
ncbi:MAG TPA: hypothetical protein VMD58_05765, partial [Acidobacteriaceae bacterium]|nr:hypothetical protein [Acidobacteriaceae bacterium]